MAPISGDLSQSEKLSEIKPPLLNRRRADKTLYLSMMPNIYQRPALPPPQNVKSLLGLVELSPLKGSKEMLG